MKKRFSTYYSVLLALILAFAPAAAADAIAPIFKDEIEKETIPLEESEESRVGESREEAYSTENSQAEEYTVQESQAGNHSTESSAGESFAEGSDLTEEELDLRELLWVCGLGMGCAIVAGIILVKKIRNDYD